MMKEKFLKNAEREYSPGRRIVALIFAALLFVVLIPDALLYYSPQLDARFDLPTFEYGVANMIVGWVFIAAGFLFAMWSIYVQFTLGRGTPIPVMATQELIIQKPYNYCRNPMALGTIVMYLGVVVLIGSVGGIIIVLLGAALLLTYIKFLEEKEMVLRFGEAYEKYREETPFILPRLR